MKYFLIWIAVAAGAITAGCATPKTGSLVTPRGQYPTDEQSVAVVMDYLSRSLKDPDSLKQFRITRGPLTMSWFRPLLFGGGHEEAWLLCFEYNAKNSYGAYAGLKTDGIAVRMTGNSAVQIQDVNWGITDARC